MRVPRETEIYEHFKKGAWYQVITIAEDVETLELYVIYKRIPKNDDEVVEDTKIWSRTVKMFMGEVDLGEGKIVQRFKRVC